MKIWIESAAEVEKIVFRKSKKTQFRYMNKNLVNKICEMILVMTLVKI